MIKQTLAILLAFTSSQAFSKESRISAFGGYYTHKPKYYPLVIHFKADSKREWGGYKIKDFDYGPASWLESYSFRNSRFKYRYWDTFEDVTAVGKVRIGRSAIRYSATAYDTYDGTPWKTIRGTFRRTPTGLIHTETVTYIDSPNVEYPPNVEYHSREIFYRK